MIDLHIRDLTKVPDDPESESWIVLQDEEWKRVKAYIDLIKESGKEEKIDIKNALEPIKLKAALNSEIFKYEYRQKFKPKDISILDYTIIMALQHCLEEQPDE